MVGFNSLVTVDNKTDGTVSLALPLPFFFLPYCNLFVDGPFPTREPVTLALLGFSSGARLLPRGALSRDSFEERLVQPRVVVPMLPSCIDYEKAVLDLQDEIVSC